MKYNFDKVIDRSGTSAEKVEGLKHIWGRTDLIPLWVADMDFATAPFVTDAIRKRCENEVLGYTGKPDSYYNAIINWVKQRYDLIVTKEVINFVPGIVPGIGMAMNCFTQKGDKVMIQPPVYHPFAWVTTRNERTLVINPLRWENGMYRMDLDAFREQIKGCKLFILCNPHNPGGVVWTLAFAPFIGYALELWTAGLSGMSFDEADDAVSGGQYWFITLLLNIALGYLDERRLRKAGVDTITFGKLAWLVPFYLWRRAKTLGQKPAYFWVWLAMLVLTVMA